MTHLRTTLAATVAALASTLGLAGAAPAAAPAADGPTTAVTLNVKNCDGCVVELSSVMRTDWEDVWVSPERKVRDGRVTVRVPTERTRGLSIAIDTPWATKLAHQTMVALRYRGYDVGDRVRFADLRDQRRASGCWAGTTADAAEMTVVVRKVTVPNNQGPTRGALAFTRTTQDYLFPMQRTYEGVLGTQDVFGCGPEA
jgi:hypothetical protein